MEVTFRISDISNMAAATRKQLPFAIIDGSDIVLQSQLSPDTPLNDHLVWLWGMLQNERRFLKSLVSEGALLTVYVTRHVGAVEIKANGAEMLHLLGANLLVEAP
jgi:hypothetical protein